ncbi:DUF4190 domain-containing protein [Brevibacterium sp.]|uniref:DUF4190 domain-containing protein n=1 Tax=Brevibacterium sp. TaxID=1701 RepID=UPI002811BCA4|nr:DUF4190 domain-containing protein [Brevibacterium sp.]
MQTEVACADRGRCGPLHFTRPTTRSARLRASRSGAPQTPTAYTGGIDYDTSSPYGTNAAYGPNSAYAPDGGCGPNPAQGPNSAHFHDPAAVYGHNSAYAHNPTAAYAHDHNTAYGHNAAYAHDHNAAYWPQMPVPVKPKANSTATWSMWLGIVGLAGGIICQLLTFFLSYVGLIFIFVTMVLWFAPILAVVFGVKAQRQVKQRYERGAGQATAGLVMGIVGIIAALLYLILLIMFAGAAIAFFGVVGAFN